MEPAHIKLFLHTHYGLGLARVLPFNPVIDMLSLTSVSLPFCIPNSNSSSCSCVMSCRLRPPLTSSLTAISPQRVLLDDLPCPLAHSTESSSMACLASLVASTLLALHSVLHSPALPLMVVRRLRSAHGGGDH